MTPSSNITPTYAQLIDDARKWAAVMFGISGVLGALLDKFNFSALAMVCFVVVYLSLLAVFGLFVEYLVRVRIEKYGRFGGLQLSLLEMILLTGIVSVFLGLFNFFGWDILAIIFFSVALLSCAVESVRIQRAKSALPARDSSGDSPEFPPGNTIQDKPSPPHTVTSE